MSFQLLSGPTDKAETLTWTDLLAQSCQAANLFRSLGVGETDVVAYLLPNATETVVTLLGGAIAGIVNPINPLLEPEQIASILRETGAKVLVTLKSFPKSDVAQKAAEAVALAPNVKTVLEVDLNHYLSAAEILDRAAGPAQGRRHAFRQGAVIQRRDEEAQPQPRLRRQPGRPHLRLFPHRRHHRHAQGRAAPLFGRGLQRLAGPYADLHRDRRDAVPAAAVPRLRGLPDPDVGDLGRRACRVPDPAGYRGDGVFDNFWKLIERWKVTFMITVPTALSALMQRPVDADVSSLTVALSGSSPLPVELYNRFEKATGVQITEGYGLTEATCLVSCNPVEGDKKVGSVGIPFPYTDVRILDCAPDGAIKRQCGADEVGEICVCNPGVWPGHTYTEADKNAGLYADGTYLRTGDLGRIDADGYLWITGRAKDLIIRGGHNIDPAVIEEALMAHQAVAFVGAIGQPDAHAGEIPCAYVELVKGGAATPDELLAFAKGRVSERAAQPKHIEIVTTLPKTAVGKVLKNELRKLAIARIYAEALKAAGVAAEVTEVVEDKKRGLVARLRKTGAADDAGVKAVLGIFTRPWEWA